MNEFEFLPDLPKPNLDNRKFEDLINECILRIPRYCPEWTNHNPSDPGITLIELFAWLTEQMLTRFNQVPLRNYVAFLELLGIRLQPPVPAQTEVTFYLTKARSIQIRIPEKTEVSTDRDKNQDAVIFTTDSDLIIGTPIIKSFLTSRTDTEIFQTSFNDYTPAIAENEKEVTPQQWWNIGNTEELFLFEESEPGNCFYLVLEDVESDNTLAGHVISLTFRGEAARATGINPDRPPLRWEAWNGKEWQSTILRQKEDDQTYGFSFADLRKQGLDPLREGAEVQLHLPLQLPNTSFGTNYKGHWIRCVYDTPGEFQPKYVNSPSIVGVAVKAIGGSVKVTECIQIKREFLGISNGKSGQVFQLGNTPVLKRQKELEEYIEVKLSGEEAEIWQEVENFADSSSQDKHYTIDSRTGVVQFGPLIREPNALKQQTQQRLQIQALEETIGWEYRKTENRNLPTAFSSPDRRNTVLERQYGKILPSGAEIYMVAYRTGGGSRGNVKAETLKVIKTSIPYVQSAINYEPARGGIDAESLTDAVIKVPQILRTRECAVTPEDFEHAAKRSHRKVARAHCVTDYEETIPGLVRLLIVPRVESDLIDFQNNFSQGMNPQKYFVINDELEKEIQFYLRDRKPLGIQVKLEEPEYVGVKVETEVILEPKYNNYRDRLEISSQLIAALYQFLNPLTGGVEGKGWTLGRSLYPSDIVSLCRNITGVRHLGNVKLFGVRSTYQGWHMSKTSEQEIQLTTNGLICSWADDKTVESGHLIHFISY